MTAGGATDATPFEGDFAAHLAAAQAGRPEGFDALVRMMLRRLVAFGRARGAQDPEGVANETLIQMCQSIASFDGNMVQFRAWVYTIARNRIIDEHRRNGRRVKTEPIPDNDLLDIADLDDGTSAIDQRQRVEQILSGLTEEQREVVLLRVLGGLSVEETALVVGRRPGAVRALQHRAIRQLRTRLAANVRVGP